MLELKHVWHLCSLLIVFSSLPADIATGPLAREEAINANIASILGLLVGTSMRQLGFPDYVYYLTERPNSDRGIVDIQGKHRGRITINHEGKVCVYS